MLYTQHCTAATEANDGGCNSSSTVAVHCVYIIIIIIRSHDSLPTRWMTKMRRRTAHGTATHPRQTYTPDMTASSSHGAAPREQTGRKKRYFSLFKGVTRSRIVSYCPCAYYTLLLLFFLSYLQLYRLYYIYHEKDVRLRTIILKYYICTYIGYTYMNCI